jgi:hypothetical protein
VLLTDIGIEKLTSRRERRKNRRSTIKPAPSVDGECRNEMEENEKEATTERSQRTGIAPHLGTVCQTSCSTTILG